MKKTTVHGLKILLQERGLKVSGNKAALIDQLLNFENGQFDEVDEDNTTIDNMAVQKMLLPSKEVERKFFMQNPVQ